MSPSPSLSHTLASSFSVLELFVIPVGGGIPAGVLLARNQGLAWPVMAVLYLISDVILALAFEPLLNLGSRWGNKSGLGYPARGARTARTTIGIRKITAKMISIAVWVLNIRVQAHGGDSDHAEIEHVPGNGDGPAADEAVPRGQG